MGKIILLYFSDAYGAGVQAEIYSLPKALMTLYFGIN
jgi:hypothetical protein